MVVYLLPNADLSLFFALEAMGQGRVFAVEAVEAGGLLAEKCVVLVGKDGANLLGVHGCGCCLFNESHFDVL